MKGDPRAIAALNDSLKYERTIAACFKEYHAYFVRWRIHRLEHWACKQSKRAAKRVDKLLLRVNVLDSIPTDERYDFEVYEIVEADDVLKVFGYFVDSLKGASATYEAGRSAAKDADDSVTRRLFEQLKEDVEDVLQAVEAKINKVKLIGAEAYIAHHMHQWD